MQKWLKHQGIFMYSAHNEWFIKTIAERFIIKTLKVKIYKKMTANE